MSDTPRRLVIGPFNRVEGDLEVKLDIAGGRVVAAYVTAPLYRGFEKMLIGRPPSDALVIAPRICGICSLAQGTAAARALASAAGIEPPPNGRQAAEIMLACENAADHLTHFCLFFMPDFAHAGYAGRVWHKEAVRRFTAISGEATRAAAAARVRLLHLMGIFGGRWPHSLAVQPGGVSKAPDKGERMRALAVLAEFRAFLESRIFGDSLERVAALDSRAALSAWMTDGPASDFRFFLTVAGDLDLAEWGKGPPRFVSLGAAGDLSGLTEDVSHAWLGGASLHPAAGVTQPEVDKADGYSWCKAPRLDGQSGETGALARQLAAGQPLLTELVAAAGGRGSVLSRVVARVIELAQLVMAMEGGLRRLGDPGAWCVTGDVPASAGGVGLVEAARGSLGHWLSVEQGRIARYQVVAPTTWNFSPRDTQGNPGPLEEALVGVPIEVPAEVQMDEQPPLVNHIVRSFDPCMSCTVH